MNKSTVRSVFVGILCIGVGMATAELYRSKVATNPTAKVATCFAGSDQLCPNLEFTTEYDQWNSLRKEINDLTQDPKIKELQGKSDQFKGMTDRLTAQVPSGYRFDEKLLKFVKVEQPVPVPSTTTSTAPIGPTAATASTGVKKKP